MNLKQVSSDMTLLQESAQPLHISTSKKAFIHSIFGQFATVICLSACMTTNAFSADNGGMAFSADLVGGKEDDTDVTTFYGTMTIPVLDRFGVHLEGAVDNAEDNLSGVGLHAYWRDENYGLFGVTASRSKADFSSINGLTSQNDIEGTTVGLEAEAYFGSIVLALQGGQISSDLEELDDENFSAVDLFWSADQNLYMRGGTRQIADSRLNRLEAGYTIPITDSSVTIYGGASWDEFDNNYVGIEYMPFSSAKSGLAFSAEVDRGEDGFDAIYLGAHYTFGPVENAPLIPIFEPISGGF